MADETQRVETVLMPMQEVIELVKQNGLFQALHIASLFFALSHLNRIDFR
jgi:hypothetical protein